ncbi:hypothetical protein BC936DRAFT_136804 [Jimgerdemannia flammicorona]|uniref:Indigoidine synthase A like protein-domain-containing protein n=1 Tax=Jimgerdemannia flammicorona TaxID=994334 RepID=A0A433CYR0_9FUNG|nr:hypothetical protein BC936DRAFT_136804 [Jimgerdemannia flammicorona]
MILAQLAGIRVFVTGGIGGVHRGAETSMDVSADLIELGRTSVAVVCAGVKSILDIGKTLEVLETHGVTVATLGSSDAFPAFYTPDSGFKSPCHLSTIENAARLIDANLRLRLKSGIVIAVPIPEEHAADGRRIQEAIDQALTEAREQGIRGNGETPFLLKRIAELTKDESLKSNIALVKHNAAVGSQIAVKLSEIQAREIQAKEIQAREIQAKKDEKTFKGHENFVQASSPAATKQQETPLSEMDEMILQKPTQVGDTDWGKSYGNASRITRNPIAHDHRRHSLRHHRYNFLEGSLTIAHFFPQYLFSWNGAQINWRSRQEFGRNCVAIGRPCRIRIRLGERPRDTRAPKEKYETHGLGYD